MSGTSIGGKGDGASNTAISFRSGNDDGKRIAITAQP